jgi:hypothetical protein
VVWDAVNEREIVLLTNLIAFGATTIAAIYKDRWEIELFFKALKQNLKVKSFVGTSENALRIQIWTALIATRAAGDGAPNQLWSWDITELRGPVKWTYYRRPYDLDAEYLCLSVAEKKGTKMPANWSPAKRAVWSEPFPPL